VPKLTEKERVERFQRGVERLAEFFDDDDLRCHLADRVREFEGDFAYLEGALGALLVGQLVGWRVLYVVHSRPVVNRYQRDLGLDFKGDFNGKPVMPERGVFAEKSKALLFADKIQDFWRVARRQVVVEGAKESVPLE
jgi:hypothetical protein